MRVGRRGKAERNERDNERERGRDKERERGRDKIETETEAKGERWRAEREIQRELVGRKREGERRRLWSEHTVNIKGVEDLPRLVVRILP